MPENLFSMSHIHYSRRPWGTIHIYSMQGTNLEVNLSTGRDGNVRLLFVLCVISSERRSKKDVSRHGGFSSRASSPFLSKCHIQAWGTTGHIKYVTKYVTKWLNEPVNQVLSAKSSCLCIVCCMYVHWTVVMFLIDFDWVYLWIWQIWPLLTIQRARQVQSNWLLQE